MYLYTCYTQLLMLLGLISLLRDRQARVFIIYYFTFNVRNYLSETRKIWMRKKWILYLLVCFLLKSDDFMDLDSHSPAYQPAASSPEKLEKALLGTPRYASEPSL